MLAKANDDAGFLAKEAAKVKEDNEARAKIRVIKARLAKLEAAVGSSTTKEVVVAEAAAESGAIGSAPQKKLEQELFDLVHQRDANPAFMEILYTVFESQHNTIVKALAEMVRHPRTRSANECLLCLCFDYIPYFALLFFCETREGKREKKRERRERKTEKDKKIKIER